VWCRRDSGVEVQREAFPAGGGSGIVASGRYPGVLWAIRDRGGQDRPGRPQNALYAYKVSVGQVGKVAGGAAFKAVPMPVPATLLATYRYRFPDPPSGCAGRTAEAMFLADDVPYLIDKAEESTLYRFPSLDPDGAVTLEKVGVLAGQVANLSGADPSSDRRRLAVNTHSVLYVYQAADPSLDGPPWSPT
jgi:hypothetical protein